jgi:hypothetical protein
MRRRYSLKVAAFILIPALAELLAAPMSVAMVLESPHLTLFQMMVSAPFYLGLLCSPGYLYLVVSDSRAHELGSAKRWWVRSSLYLAIVAGLAGVAGSFLMILFLPPSAGAIALCLWLLWRFEGWSQRRRPDGPVRTPA